MDRSMVEYCHDHSGYRCGYCKSEDGNFSHGMWAHVMTTLDYQDLIDRGWRRSGQYCYKPTLDKACCPMYPIRCSANDFMPSKSHKKVMKKFRRFVEENFKSGSSSSNPDSQQQNSGSSKTVRDNKDCDIEARTAFIEGNLGLTPKELPPRGSRSVPTASMPRVDEAAVPMRDLSDDKGKSSPSRKADSGDKRQQQQQPKAKEIRRQRWMEKQAAKGLSTTLSSAAAKDENVKSLEDWLACKNDGCHKFEIRTVRVQPDDEMFCNTFAESLAVYQKYQMAVHGDTRDKCSAKQFKGFLCKSPLMDEDYYGSYHRHYLIDGKIIAVGVIDILPRCVSSVYLYYDPDFSFLSLGTYTSLSEIAFVRRLSSVKSSLQFYYLGFYIHSCPKMRYKAQFSPSYLLCPEAYTWTPVESCFPLLDVSAYSRLNPVKSVGDPAKFDSMADVSVYFHYQEMDWNTYMTMSTEGRLDKSASTQEGRLKEQEEVEQYGKLVGKTVVTRMLLYRDH